MAQEEHHHHHHRKRDQVSRWRDRTLRNNVLRHKVLKWLKIILTLVAIIMVLAVIYLYQV